MQFFKKNSVKNVCLLGLMGSGKSVIGKELSKFYNMDFLDTDQIIEEKMSPKKLKHQKKYIYKQETCLIKNNMT